MLILQSLIVIMNKIMRSASMLLLFLSWNISGLQNTQIPPTPDPGPSPPPPGLPIDNYLVVLFLAGLLFGTYKIYKTVKKGQP